MKTRKSERKYKVVDAGLLTRLIRDFKRPFSAGELRLGLVREGARWTETECRRFLLGTCKAGVMEMTRANGGYFRILDTSQDVNLDVPEPVPVRSTCPCTGEEERFPKFDVVTERTFRSKRLVNQTDDMVRVTLDMKLSDWHRLRDRKQLVGRAT